MLHHPQRFGNRLATLSLALLWVSFGTTNLPAQTEHGDYVSLQSEVVGTYSPKPSGHTAGDMANAAQAFIDTLTDEQRTLLCHDLSSQERREWTNLPPRPDAAGLRFQELNEAQTRAACDMLATMLSPTGYAKVCGIMLADDQLLNQGRPRPGFGVANFAMLLFGTPSADAAWAFQLDGHHIGINLSITGEAISMSPSFIGSQPETFRIQDKRYRPLADEIDVAYALVNSLTDEQRKAAVLSPRRGQLQIGPGADGFLLPSAGVSCKTFTEAQREMLLKLIRQWVNCLPPQSAQKEMEAVTGEIEETFFSWNGGLAAGSDVSYAIRGPSIMIEYVCQGPPDRPLDHLHTMYRNPKTEYGAIQQAADGGAK